ncbi:hypothetical protein V2J09_009473 [Rumex salicifolius]
MDSETPRANHVPQILHGAFPALSATLFIAMGYIDPGKWISCIDSGARFGGELFVFLFLFNLMAVLCQYLSAHIGAITGKNLAQICNYEYDKFNCILLGIQAELSIIMSDLAMILGIANALHMMFRVDLFSAVLLTALTAILYPIFSTLLESSKANVILSRTAGLTFVCYVLGILIAQPEISFLPINLPSKLMGENVYALMTLLGASIMPHNFFLHSSIVQRFQGSPGVSRASKAYDNFFSIFAVFSGIFLVNYVLMNSASNIHISSLSWEVGGESGQTILYDFFGLDLPGWLHCATVRIFAIVPALYCLWYSGAEGLYQMLLSTQVVVALLLPPSVIALYRVASSGAIMGTNKVSTAMEFLLMMSFMAMIGLQLVFFGEMVFGDGAWLGYLRWNMGSISPYFILIVTGFGSLCLTCRLFVTPLRSSDHSSGAEPFKRVRPQDVRESLAVKQVNDRVDSRYREEIPCERPGLVPSSEEVLETLLDPPAPIYEFKLPDNIMETDQSPYLAPIEEISTVKESSVLTVSSLEQPSRLDGTVLMPEVVQDLADAPSLATRKMETETRELSDKTLRVEGESTTREDGEEQESWEPEEMPKEMVQVAPLAAPEGLRSLSGKLDEGGSGTGSLSRLSGLGRAARRQLAAVLDEFWGKLYDFHGQLTQDAKAKKLDLLLGSDSNSKPSLSLQEAVAVAKDFRPQFQSDPMMNSGLCDPLTQQRLHNSIGSLYGVQKGSSPSMWPDKAQMLDAYMQSTGSNALDNSERRYSSLRLPPRSEGVNQPVTMHGYEVSSCLNRTMMDSSADYMDGQRKYASMKLPSSSLGMLTLRDPLSYGLGPKRTNGFSTMQPSSFQNLAATRNNIMLSDNRSSMNMMQSDRSNMMQSDSRSSMNMMQSDRSNMMQSDSRSSMNMMQSDNRSSMNMMQSDRSNYELFSPATADDATNQNNSKKYHSLPDISGYSAPLRDVYLSDKYAQLGSPNTTSGYPNSIGRATPERSLYSSLASRMGPPGFDDLSPRQVRRDVYPSRSYSGLDTGSIWCKQPYEQYGVANKTSLGLEGSHGQKSVTNVDSASSIVDQEAILLQSLRNCILKLLKLEGSEWLFRQGDGVDEDLIDRVAARERFAFEAEFKDMKMASSGNESAYSAPGGMRPGSAMKGDGRSTVSSVPHCGEGCVWKADLIVSFGVWCIHRVLELSLMESRPELWGKYTYVLNRLQGVIEPAFFKQRNSLSPCFCIQVPTAYQQRLSPVSGITLPPTARSPRGKFTTSSMLIEIIKDVEIAISSRKGRSGTAAGDVAFPKGKENLASVLKRYKRRLSNKPVGTETARPGSRNLLGPAHYGS